MAFIAHAMAFDVEKAKLSVPRIVLLLDDRHAETGSGFVVHAEADYCIVATNFHVVQKRTDDTPLYVLRKVADGVESHPGTVIWEDDQRDLALIKVTGLKADALPLSTVPPEQAADAYSIGYPGVADDEESSKAFYKMLKNSGEGIIPDPDGEASTYLEASISKGVIRREITSHWEHLPATLPIRIIQDDVNIGHGNSGGPLFNTDGQVVGVNTASVVNGSDRFTEASEISVLTGQLDAQGISWLKGDPIPHIAPVAVAAGAGGRLTFMLYSVFGVAVAALVVAVRRKNIVESYSHYVRRKPDASGHSGRDYGSSPRPAAQPSWKQPPPAPRGDAPVAAAHVLEGENPEDHTRIKLNVDEALLEKAKDRVIIGRNEKQAHLCIRNKSVSGQHLALIRRDSRFLVEDRDSSNGTSLNGRKLLPHAPVPIEDGDLLLAGDVLLRFKRVTSAPE